MDNFKEDEYDLIMYMFGDRIKENSDTVYEFVSGLDDKLKELEERYEMLMEEEKPYLIQFSKWDGCRCHGTEILRNQILYFKNDKNAKEFTEKCDDSINFIVALADDEEVYGSI